MGEVKTYSGKKILLVEDDSINQELMADILGGMQLAFDVANNGIEGVEKALAGNYDLILMDVRMPEKDGIQATKDIREKEGSTKHTPIIALTASIVEGSDELISYGFDDHVMKPLTLAEFRSKLDKYLTKAA